MSNFNQTNLGEMAAEYLAENPDVAEALLINQDLDESMSELELVEWYAEHNGLISNEDELTERFDETLQEILDEKTYQEAKRLANDSIQINEMFSAFADGLCSDGELHQSQVSEYEYMGDPTSL